MCIRDRFNLIDQLAGGNRYWSEETGRQAEDALFEDVYKRQPLKQQDDGTETENQDDELDETLMGMDYIPYTCLLYTSRCV